MTATTKLRVTVTDAWDTVTVIAGSDTTIADLKQQALGLALGWQPDPSIYEVKYRGALMLDEQCRIADLNLPDGAPLIVLPSRRWPVR